MQQLTVLKIGGKILDNKAELEDLLSDFALIAGLKVLVHGGGKAATNLSIDLGLKPNMVNGRRVTDKETLDVAIMVYGGLLNKNVVAYLQSKNVNALGVTGADLNLIKSEKRPVKDVDFGFVGDVKEVDAEMLAFLLSKNIVPVFCAITHDKQGQLFNTNADTIASEVASAGSKNCKVRLVYCFEKPGVLSNADDDSSVIKNIEPTSYKKLLADGTIFEGMIPKMDNSFDALHKGASEVCICDKNGLKTIGTDAYSGTRIKL
jgi:acetylglutamate kinase